MNNKINYDLVSICICTFRREILLNELLEEIYRQTIPSEINIEIIIVDNSPEYSAKHLLEIWKTKKLYPLYFFHEPNNNIALARNLAIRQAKGEWLLFIDDDEKPCINWVAKMLETQRHYHADVVFAPVIPKYSADTPQWLIRGGFFDRPRFKTGTEITISNARTGNVLIRHNQALLIPGPFNENFGKTGGEDSVFFRQLLKLNAKFIWCDEAEAMEDVPTTRANFRWLLKRSYRVGQTFIRGETTSYTGKLKLFKTGILYARAFLQLITAVVLFIVTLPFSWIQAIRWLRTAITQLGKLSVMMGFIYHEYK